MIETALPLKIAVLGAGLIGERHARLLARLHAFELCAIIDPAKGAKAIADELLTNHYSNIEVFFESGIACDGVIIATPNETHKTFALHCFEKGLPCLIEKPLAANSDDAKAIVEASTTSGIAVLVGHHRRHHLISRILKEKLDKKACGQLIGAQLTWVLRKPDDYFQTGQWRTQEGGGPIWINLIHEIDLLRYFLGEITEVSAMVSSAVRGHAVEDLGVVNMRCESGVLVSAIISDAAPSPWHFEGGSGENPNICQTGHDGLRIFGTKGSIVFPSLTEWCHAHNDGHWGTPIHSKTNTHDNNLGGEVALSAQLYHFAEVIKGTCPPLVSAFDGMQSVRIIEAIHRSAVKGTTIRVSADYVIDSYGVNAARNAASQ